jgi:hypothetical protein
MSFSSDYDSPDRFDFYDLSVLALVEVTLFESKLEEEKLLIYFPHELFFF